ncbi:MAG TPA: c-type cytochrome domain-containing protein [Methylomirabilota bacterium]|nr:c-type cytochrome domain-containing protein [Methylomirabilota bacterium]
MKHIVLGLFATAAATSLFAADVDVSKLPPVAAKKDVTFDKDIKPIFEKSCFSCHGAEKQKAKLRVDSREATLKGSSNGEIVVVGKSEKSSLVHSIAGLIEDGMMPPEDKGEPLTREQIGLVRAWIDQGAK